MVLVVIATICALAWMCYRVSTLLNIPIPTLVKLLGLDLPAPPRVSLHGISSDTITLHWSVPEKAGTVAKHIIQINGINVGESEKRGATSVTVTGLNPNQRYNARVIAANAQNFQAPGQLIRLRTRRRSQGSSVGGVRDRGEATMADEGPLPMVHAAVESVPPPSPQQHGRSGNHGGAKKTTKGEGRRNSPAAGARMEQGPYGGDRGDGGYTVESLTADLDVVRNEITETEAQLAVAEEEFKATEAELRGKLDELKQKKNEEDAARQRIKAETKSLEEARRSAEATRARTEKVLKAKEYEIKRMQDDIARWEAEKVVAQEKVQELKTVADESKDNAATTEKELGSDIKESQSQICNLEEDIRNLASSIKMLEQHYERLKQLEEQEARQVWEDTEKEGQWKDRQRNVEYRYMQIYNAYQAAEQEYKQSVEALNAHQLSRRGSGSGGGSGADSITKKHKSRRNRNRKSRQNMSPFGPQDTPISDPYFLGASTGYQQLSPTFSHSNPGPFFNYAVTSPTEIQDMDAGTIMDLTGGAPMSPTADALLPSNLFTFDDNPPSPKPSSSSPDNFILDLAGDGTGQLAPQSPLSSGSVSQSTSPRSSLNHFPLFPSLTTPSKTSPEPMSSLSPIGSNRPGSSSQSLHDENAPPLNGGRKFVRLFSNSLTPFTRQRGKTLPHDGLPPIGSLRPSEHHSFPKNDSSGLDPIGTRRRSGSYGSWSGSIDFPQQNPASSIQRTDSTASRRSTTLNQFNPSFDPIDPDRLFNGSTITAASPRPLSIASFDQHFPAPSSDVSAAFGWPAAPPGLTPPSGNRWMSRSRPVSRPISPNAANISTTSLSILPSQSHHPLASYFSSSSSAAQQPRLNPNAPTFQARSGNVTVGDGDGADGHHHLLDPSDSISINTDTSALTASTTGASASGASLELVPTKESILSRFSALSRKGSTSKFNIGWNKKEKGDKGDKEKDEGGTVGGSGLLDPSSAISPTPTGRHLWQWGKKAESDVSVSADEKEEKEKKDKRKEEDKDVSSTTAGKEGSSTSPWLKSTQSAGTFFGAIGRRKTEKKEDDTSTAASEVDDDMPTPTIEQPSEKKGLGIFGRRKTEKKEEKAVEKIEEVNREA